MKKETGKQVAKALGATVHIDIQLPERPEQATAAEDKATYGNDA